jgi:hypothetical protein
MYRSIDSHCAFGFVREIRLEFDIVDKFKIGDINKGAG